ncbi:MAG: Grx4 family monothiol glutaredoxin [Rhodobacteraceae bacterium]|nr:Grx4 family monothiol glutaredoxin [Paracoccaceae bacterium]
MTHHDRDIGTALDQLVRDNETVLFMKGSKHQPQCGFSSKVAGVLNYLNVNYLDVNVLDDETVREGIKVYSDWPTIPQLYIKGEFIGGCDIVIEMTMSGELDTLLEDKGIPFDKSAAEAIRRHNG